MRYTNLLFYLVALLSILPQYTIQDSNKPEESQLYKKFKIIEEWKSIINQENRIESNQRQYCRQKSLYCKENEIKNKINEIIQHSGSKIVNFNQELIKIWRTFIVNSKNRKNINQEINDENEIRRQKNKQLKIYIEQSKKRDEEKIKEGIDELSKKMKISKSHLSKIPLETLIQLINKQNKSTRHIRCRCQKKTIGEIKKKLKSKGVRSDCKKIVEKMTFSIKDLSPIKQGGMENLLNKEQLKMIPIDLLEKSFKTIFNGKFANFWITKFEMQGSSCIFRQQTLMKRSICNMCSDSGDSLLSDDGRFILQTNQCKNILKDCLQFWRKLILIQEEIGKIDQEINLEINGQATSLILAISKNGDFWKKVLKKNMSQESRAVLCEGFFNILNRTPPILRNKEVKKALSSLNEVKEGANKGRELVCASDDQFYFGDIIVQGHSEGCIHQHLVNINNDSQNGDERPEKYF